MASLNKQQKRAKRAKIKAKQINIHGRKPAALDDDLGEIGEPIPEYTLAMFSKMRDARGHQPQRHAADPCCQTSPKSSATIQNCWTWKTPTTKPWPPLTWPPTC